LKPLNQYDKASIVARELIEEIFDEEDEIERSYMIADCSLKAQELGVLAIFKKLIAERSRIQKGIDKSVARSGSYNQGVTDFAIPNDKPYENMLCGSWVANGNGIVSYNIMGMEQRACHHPVLPIRRLSNIETNEEKITLAFRRDYQWREVTVDKDVISSATKIIALSKFGISVTSENAKHLVKYLNDVENMNSDAIKLDVSTSKLGWHGTEFIPFDSEIVFDGDTRFKDLFKAIHTKGSEDAWMKCVKDIRSDNRMETKILLAASFASVLVKVIGCLPFFVDLWGETEGGKSVTLMLAASVWANPDENQYIGDYKSTDVALEVRADVLNNLPVLLDDTSNATKKIVDDFENIIYRLCSGKGKSRSNKDLGANRENNWKTCFITNGERPLSGYVNQGGAINRIIEVEAGNNIFKRPQKTVDILKNNYGFAGRRFVEVVRAIGKEEIKRMYDEICEELFQQDKMQKQAMSLACILLADKIATEHLFKDGQYISMEDARKCLIDRTELSENERCYRYIMDKVAMNGQRFDVDANCEQWGLIEGGYIIFFSQAFDELCRVGGFSKKTFLSWATKKGYLQTDSGRSTKVKKIDGNTYRCVWIKQDDGIKTDENGFMKVDESIQNELPFD
jgi:hypothetical protein